MPSHRCTLALPADPAETERAGEAVGTRLRPGDTLALVGPMGAGKTTFVRGLARGLGLDDPEGVASPTYLLVVEHEGPVPLLHADAYLPEKLAGFLADGGLEYLFDPHKVVAVEWGDRIRKMLPESTLWLTFEHAPEGGRRLGITTDAPDRFPWLEDLRTMWGAC